MKRIVRKRTHTPERNESTSCDRKCAKKETEILKQVYTCTQCDVMHCKLIITYTDPRYCDDELPKNCHFGGETNWLKKNERWLKE